MFDTAQQASYESACRTVDACERALLDAIDAVAACGTPQGQLDTDMLLAVLGRHAIAAVRTHCGLPCEPCCHVED